MTPFQYVTILGLTVSVQCKNIKHWDRWLCTNSAGSDQILGSTLFNIPYAYFGRIIFLLTLLHSERPKLYAILAFLSAVGLNQILLQLLQLFSVFKFLHHCDFRMLLWHGSRLTNWVGILSQGLRIAPPEAPVTGYMVSIVTKGHSNTVHL